MASADKPEELNIHDFHKILDLHSGGYHPWFVKFYAPWCPHCQALEPIWIEFYRKNKKHINVASVDCTDTYGEPVCN